ncbi:MAG TPA: biotin-dependent carboxyltransferase family protein [Mycobacteriales bacterium]
MLTVVRAGPLTTVQDLGRPGYAHLGVPPSGAAHAAALVRANRLVGNDAGAAALETTLLGVTVRLDEPRWVAVTGAEAPVTVDGEPVSRRFRVPAGATVRVGTATLGLRSYLAVGGGIAVPPVLGSRSTDRLSGLGPAPLADGDRLPLGADPGAAPDRRTADRRAGPTALERLADGSRLWLHPGPRQDWVTPAGWALLRHAEFTVSRDSDRVGVRLDGPRLEWARAGELPSEGLVTGAVQVPPDGRPTVFLTDHPTTGGYPVAGVLDPSDLPVLAQARPGTVVRFGVD